MRKEALLLTLLALVLLVGCRQPPLKVAVLASLGGSQEGAILAADQWNARGGALGRRIELVLKGTSADDPQTAARAAREAIDSDHVRYIVGDDFSTLSIPVSDIANAAKVIQVTPNSTAAGVTVDESGATKPYVFRACFDNAAQGKLGAAFAVRSLKAHRAFVMVDPTNVYIESLADAFSASFESLGGVVVGKAIYSVSDADFSSTLEEIRRRKPDVVYLSALSPPLVNLATRQAREKGIRTPFLGGDGWDDAALDPQAAEGSYFTTHFDPEDPRPRAQTFVREYRAKYGNSPNFVAALSYDALNMVLTALSSAGSDSTDAVRSALETGSFDAVTGTITLNRQHTAVKGTVVMQIKDGKIAFNSYLSP